MKTFRIFVEDRSPGKFSGLTDVQAMDARSALRKVGYRDVRRKAIAWPAKSAQDQKWLDEHVNRDD